MKQDLIAETSKIELDIKLWYLIWYTGTCKDEFKTLCKCWVSVSGHLRVNVGRFTDRARHQYNPDTGLIHYIQHYSSPSECAESPVHFDHFSLQHVPDHLLDRNLTSVTRTPAQRVGQVIPRAEREDSYTRDEQILTLSGDRKKRWDGERLFVYLNMYIVKGTIQPQAHLHLFHFNFL